MNEWMSELSELMNEWLRSKNQNDRLFRDLMNSFSRVLHRSSKSEASIRRAIFAQPFSGRLRAGSGQEPSFQLWPHPHRRVPHLAATALLEHSFAANFWVKKVVDALVSSIAFRIFVVVVRQRRRQHSWRWRRGSRRGRSWWCIDVGEGFERRASRFTGRQRIIRFGFADAFQRYCHVMRKCCICSCVGNSFETQEQVFLLVAFVILDFRMRKRFSLLSFSPIDAASLEGISSANQHIYTIMRQSSCGSSGATRHPIRSHLLPPSSLSQFSSAFQT